MQWNSMVVPTLVVKLKRKTISLTWKVSGGTVLANISNRDLSLSAFAVEAGEIWGMRKSLKRFATCQHKERCNGLLSFTLFKGLVCMGAVAGCQHPQPVGGTSHFFMFPLLSCVFKEKNEFYLQLANKKYARLKHRHYWNRVTLSELNLPLESC